MKKKIIKGGKSIVLRQFLSFPLNTLGIMIVSKLLTPIDFGVQAILLPLLTVSFMVIDLGTTQALIQTRGVPDYSNLFKKIMGVKIINSFMVILCFFFISPWLLKKFLLPYTYFYIFPACSLIALIQSYREYLSVRFQRLLEWNRLINIEIFEILIYNLFLVVSAYFLKTAWCFLIALAFRFAIGIILLNIFSKHSMECEDSNNLVKFYDLLRFGIPLQFTSIFAVLNKLVNPVIVGNLEGTWSVGLINWASYIVSLPTMLTNPFMPFLFSILAYRQRQKKDDVEIISTILFWGTLFISILSLTTSLFLDLLINFFLGLKWIIAVKIVFILMLGNIIYFPVIFMSSYLTAKGYSRLWLLINIVGTVLLWFFLFVGVILFNEVGYAIGYIIASLLAFLLLNVLMKRKFFIEFDYKNIIYFILAMAVSIMISEYFKGVISLPLLQKSIICWNIGLISFFIILLPVLVTQIDSFYKLKMLFQQGKYNEF